MPRIVRCSIIQASNAVPATEPLPAQKKAMVEKHLGLIRQAAAEGAQIVCLQEIFSGPYFCAEQEVKWYEMTEPVPDGPTVSLMRSHFCCPGWRWNWLEVSNPSEAWMRHPPLMLGREG